MNKKGNTKLITFNDETLTVTQWAERLGVSYITFHNYRRKTGSHEAAIAHISANGVKKPRSKVKLESPYKRNLLMMFLRLQRGLPVCEQDLKTASLSGFWEIDSGTIA